MPEAPDADTHVWAGAHADINLITALPRATAPGQQVLTDAGWIDAVPPEGKVIINTGMMLEVISNGAIPPGHPHVHAHPTLPPPRSNVAPSCPPPPRHTNPPPPP